MSKLSIIQIGCLAYEAILTINGSIVAKIECITHYDTIQSGMLHKTALFAFDRLFSITTTDELEITLKSDA